MKYEDYTTEDFLTDKRFIDWVKNPSEESNLFWTRWINEHEYKRQTLIDAFHIISAIHFKEEEVEYDQIVKNLDRIISHNRPVVDEKKRKQRRLRRSIYSVAASVALLISVVTISTLYDLPHSNVLTEQPAIIKKNNPKGQKSTFILPDSTIVVLNAESTLSYPEAFREDKREVMLTGEAYFDVHPDTDKPFLVKSGDISTRALGTSFNIKAFENDETISVSLISGKVVINNQAADDRDKIFLSPGEKYLYNILKKENKKLRFDMYEDLAWKDGILYFKQSDLNEFISTIERWYDVKVTVIGTPGNNWRINGRFKNESLHNVLEGLSFVHQVRYTLKDKNVVLYF